MINSKSVDENLRFEEADLQLEWVSELPEVVVANSTLHDQMLQICLDTVHQQMKETLNTMLQNLSTLETSPADERLATLANVRKQANKLNRLMDGLRYIVNDPAEKQ